MIYTAFSDTLLHRNSAKCFELVQFHNFIFILSTAPNQFSYAQFSPDALHTSIISLLSPIFLHPLSTISRVTLLSTTFIPQLPIAKIFNYLQKNEIKTIKLKLSSTNDSS